MPFKVLWCFNGHFRNAEERNSLLFSPIPNSHPAPLSSKQGEKTPTTKQTLKTNNNNKTNPKNHQKTQQKFKIVTYPKQKFSTRSEFSEWCSSAALRPRPGLKLHIAKWQNPEVWGGRTGRLIASLAAELSSSSGCLLSLRVGRLGGLNKEVKV